VNGGDALGRLRRLRGVTWRWRDDAPRDAKATPGIGVVAQDVEAVFPELVQLDARGFKTVHYVGLIGPLIEAVKELDERLRRVEERLAQLAPPD
jgi:hypothetical protein